MGAEEHGGLAFGYKGLGVVTEESNTLTASPLFAASLGWRYLGEYWWFAVVEIGDAAGLPRVK